MSLKICIIDGQLTIHQKAAVTHVRLEKILLTEPNDVLMAALHIRMPIKMFRVTYQFKYNSHEDSHVKDTRIERFLDIRKLSLIDKAFLNFGDFRASARRY